MKPMPTRQIATTGVAGMHMPAGEAMWASPASDEIPEIEVALEEKPKPVLDITAIRQRLGLSQSQFAEMFHISVGTLRGWEQGRRSPHGAALTLLKVIEKNPDAVRDALSEEVDLSKAASLIYKKALGLLDIPKEIPKDYQFNQRPHIFETEDDKIGTFDRESPVDLPPVNDVDDQKPENKMKQVLSDLASVLKQRGYHDYSNLIKKAYEPMGLSRSPDDKFPPLSEPKPDTADSVKAYLSNTYGLTEADFSALSSGTKSPEQLYKEHTTLNSSHQLSHGDFNISRNKDDFIAKATEYQTLTKYYPSQYPSGLRGKSQPVTQEQMESALGMPGYETNTAVPAGAAPEAATGRVTDWNSYGKQGPLFAGFATKWQQSPAPGYDSSFQSFVAWYKAKSATLGDFGPADASEHLDEDLTGSLRQTDSVSTDTGTPDVEPTSQPGTSPQATESPVGQLSEQDVTSYIAKAISLMGTRDLKFNTPFRPERRQTVRWVNHNFGGNVNTAALEVLKTQPLERWNTLIQEDTQSSKQTVQYHKHNATTRSGNFFEAVYQGLKSSAHAQRQPHRMRAR